MAWNRVDLSDNAGDKNDTQFEIDLQLESKDDNNKILDKQTVETPDEEQEIEVEEETQEASEDEQETEEVIQKEEKPRKRSGRSRAKKRIEQLASENKKLKDELNSRIDQLEQKSTATNIQSRISDLDDKLTTLKSRIAKAYQEEQFDLAADLTEQMSELKIDRKVLAATSQEKPKKEEPRETQTTQEPYVPEAQEDWVEENPWFEDPESRDEKRLARYIKKQGRKLVQDEGYELDEDELYEELTSLAQKYVAEKKLSVDGFELPKEEAPKKKVSPSTPKTRSSGVTKKGNKITVKLSPEEQRVARRFGMSDEEYAREKIAMENKSKTGYTPIQ